MTKTDAQIIEEILVREGGYVDHPADKGGPTNFGITLATLRAWRNNPDLTAKDVMALRRDEAKLIYEQEYIRKPRLHLIPDDRLRAHLIDFGVNSGPGTAVRALQKVLRVKADGAIGPVTLAALRRMGAAAVNNAVMAERIRLLARLVARDTRQTAFLVGWMDRALEFMI